MIKELTTYTVICDRCGKDHSDDTEFYGCSDKKYSEDMATESGWAREGDSHYCPDCVVEMPKEDL